MALNRPIYYAFLAGSACLGLAAFLLLLNILFFSGPSFYRQQLERNLQHELSLAQTEMEEVKEALAHNPEAQFSRLPKDLQHQYYIFKNRSLWFWSDYHYVPVYEDVAGKNHLRFLDLPEGKFIALRGEQELEEGEVAEIFMLIPLYMESMAEVGGLSFNKDIFISPDFTLFSPSHPADHPVVSDGEGQVLFKVALGPNYLNGPNVFLLLASLLAFLGGGLLCVVLYDKSREYLENGFTAKAFLLLAGSLAAIRALMLATDFPYRLYPFNLFDPTFYASSIINPSLGDFLLNVLAVLLVVLLFWKYWQINGSIISAWLEKRAGYTPFIVGLTLLHIGFLYFYYQVLKALFFHGQYVLDITSSLQVNSIKLSSWLIFCLLTFIYIVLNYFLCMSLQRLMYKRQKMLLLYAGMGVPALLLSVWWPVFLLVPLAIGIYFLFYLFIQRRQRLQPYNYHLLVFIFGGAVVSAFSGAWALYEYDVQSRRVAKERFAQQLLVENDLVGEYLLSEAVSKIQEDPFIKNRFFNPLFSKQGISQKVERMYLGRYFDKYDSQVLLFDLNGTVINHPNRYLNYHALLNKAAEGESETAYPGLFLLKDDTPGASGKRYQQFIPIRENGAIMGYMLVDLTLKRYLTNTIYPELFLGKELKESPTQHMDYAVFRNGALEYNAGAFDYVHQLPEGFLQQPELYEEGIEVNGYHHLGKKGADGKVVIITDESAPAYFIVSNFSFLFLLCVFCVTLWLLCYVVYYRFSIQRLDFTAKIQLYLNFAVFIPLLVVSASILSLINNSFKEDTEQEYFDKAESISRNMAEVLENQRGISATNQEELSNALERIARYAEADLHLYSTTGELVATNQPVIYQQNYLAAYINPLALAEIKEQNSRQVLLNEVVNNLQYKSVYMAVRSPRNGALLGILSLPFFESGYQLAQQLTAVFSSIVTIFASLFILFLLLLYLLSRGLTGPLRYIAQKMKKVSLTGKNEPLHWTTNDEIGMLVKEYNHMLINLQESKEALSRSEKESAWREMAKQVAHEIKNPLTPMKLSLQHLSRMLRGKLESEQEEDRVEKTVKSLLDQIDTLSDIATSFSAFAKMPVPKQERFDVAVVLKGVVRLYSSQKQAVEAEIEAGAFWVLGDEQMMQRTFNNLILNGLQSVPDTREPEIHVRLQRSKQGRVLIEIEDNGEGIDQEIREKVFVPNFSTKYTGSGLGLAIAKRGIEHAGGRIWFETEPRQGTVFYIELPLIT
ncbi:sensor histidine kinase [Nafulsella turpanensis]|uniref:sensor histidine kinase n=1 Tax=Nafulsella turpanensis TaxID=1265690 RepID=UPI000346A36E|nr:HAMP domain-containing sensor histidine kinase [Nafulsella turpanensis]